MHIGIRITPNNLIYLNPCTCMVAPDDDDDAASKFEIFPTYENSGAFVS